MFNLNFRRDTRQARGFHRPSFARVRGEGVAGHVAEGEGAFPLWLPVAVLTIPVVVRLSIVARRRRRVRAGLCAGCEYDPRGNVSGVCPECGCHLTPQAIYPNILRIT